MSASITPASPVVFPATLTVPADGDLANAASVVVPMQDMLTGIDGARAGHYGQKRHRRIVSTNLADLTIGPLGYVMVTSGGVWRIAAYTLASTITAATKLGAALANSTRYYVYAGIVAGSPDFIVTTDPPDTYRAYRTGNTDHLYITTFLTDTAAHIIPFRHDGMRYRYFDVYWGVAGSPAAALAFVNLTQATDGAKVSVSGFGSGAPSYVTHATVELTTSLNAGGTASYVNIFNNVSAPYNAGLANMVLICDAGRSVTIEREIMIASSTGNWYYQRTDADFTAVLTGWWE
jgi:hypothetical protein